MRSQSSRGKSFIRLKTKKVSRELETTSGNFFTMRSGGSEKDRVEATVARVTDDMISVVPASDLPDGQYLLMFDEAFGFYDFGIAAPKS